MDVGDSEDDEVFWRGFLSAVKRRGLTGVYRVYGSREALLRELDREPNSRTRCAVS